MKISAKIQYAALATLELAARYETGAPVQIRCIAADHGIPSQFLVQILLQLKTAGLVISTRGASGGYQLARSPDDITLGNVVDAIEGTEPEASPLEDGSAMALTLRETWLRVADSQRELLHGTTLTELVEQAEAKSNAMYYI